MVYCLHEVGLPVVYESDYDVTIVKFDFIDNLVLKTMYICREFFLIFVNIFFLWGNRIIFIFNFFFFCSSFLTAYLRPNAKFEFLAGKYGLRTRLEYILATVVALR